MSRVLPQGSPAFIMMSVQRAQAFQSVNHGPGPTSFRDPYGRKAPETFRIHWTLPHTHHSYQPRSFARRDPTRTLKMESQMPLFSMYFGFAAHPTERLMSDCIIFPPGSFQKLFRESYFRTQPYLSESLQTWDFIEDFSKPIFRIMVNGISFLTETVLPFHCWNS